MSNVAFYQAFHMLHVQHMTHVHYTVLMHLVRGTCISLHGIHHFFAGRCVCMWVCTQNSLLLMLGGSSFGFYTLWLLRWPVELFCGTIVLFLQVPKAHTRIWVTYNIYVCMCLYTSAYQALIWGKYFHNCERAIFILIFIYPLRTSYMKKDLAITYTHTYILFSSQLPN